MPTTVPRPIEEVVEESGELQPAGSFMWGGFLHTFAAMQVQIKRISSKRKRILR